MAFLRHLSVFVTLTRSTKNLALMLYLIGMLPFLSLYSIMEISMTMLAMMAAHTSALSKTHALTTTLSLLTMSG